MGTFDFKTLLIIKLGSLFQSWVIWILGIFALGISGLGILVLGVLGFWVFWDWIFRTWVFCVWVFWGGTKNNELNVSTGNRILINIKGKVKVYLSCPRIVVI